MQFLIVSDLGWCNIYQVFDSVVEDMSKKYKLTVELRAGHGK